MKLQQRKKKLTRAVSVALASVIGLSTLTGCMQGNESQTDDTERVLRIATTQGYGPDDEWFRTQFTELFEFANPNVTIEIVPAVDYSKFNYRTEPMTPEEQPDPMAELKKLMQGDNPPDLVMIEYANLPELVNENLLAPLDPLITADEFDTSKIVPTVLEGIKSASTDGRLYAMAPLFSSSALFYNKKIFNDAGVPYPTDGMTWDDVFLLAQQLSGGEEPNRTYGFSFQTYQGSDPFYDMQMYVQPLGLRMYDDAAENMTVDSDQWEQVWQKIIDLRKQEIIPGPINWEEQQQQQPMREPGPFDWDSFLSGRTAMAVSNYWFINQILEQRRAAETNDNIVPVEWDVVTMPVHQAAPDVGGQIHLQGLMGINANAQNQETAWEFLKFMNGPDWARLKSRSQGTLVSNIDYIKPKEGLEYNIEAFYQLKPAPVVDESALWRKYPHLHMVQSIGQQKFQEVLNGDKEVRQALQEWQTEGNAMLKQMREDPNFMPNFGEPMPTEGEVVID